MYSSRSASPDNKPLPPLDLGSIKKFEIITSPIVDASVVPGCEDAEPVEGPATPGFKNKRGNKMGAKSLSRDKM